MDEAYKKELKCNRITGAEEFKDYIQHQERKNFLPGSRKNKYILDSHDFCNLKSGSFTANLHVHTQNSDGAADTETILHHAEAIARYNSKFGSPFMLAITDHDTIAGAQEAFEIFKNNPDRFQHLKLIPGLEISTVETKLKNQTAPLAIHLLVYGINPYDTRLNEFLKEKSRLKLELTKETIENLNNELSEELGFEFTLSEAALVHEMIAKGFDEVKRPLMKYTSGKILHNFYLPEAGFTYEKPIRAYKQIFKSPDPYYKLYKKALEKYINRELPQIPAEIETLIQRAKSIYEKAHPTMSEIPEAFSEFEETVKFISSLDYGYMSVAHPARTNIRNIKDNPENIFTNIFKNFKSAGNERACFYEGYYGSYEGERTFNLLPAVDAAAAKFNLIPAGGLDSHGRDIITRCPYT